MFSATLFLGLLSISTKVFAAGPCPPNLNTFADYAILGANGAYDADSTVSQIVGDIGSVSGTLGIDATLSADGTYSTSPIVTGKIYTGNYASPSPAKLQTGLADLHTAYNDLMGRTSNLGGLTLSPGLYNFPGAVTISSTLTITGSANDYYIFQIQGALHHYSQIVLSGGIIPENIFWGVAGTATFYATSHFEGILIGGGPVWFQDYGTGDDRIPLSGTGRFASFAFVEFQDATLISREWIELDSCCELTMTAL
ncbi:antifreeze protein [Roridomyces roridus]|uniref:Antifreeze protein n=1 Tax=Roridomyces roridus TaxID=1738132 RepID=A0AAD7C1D9_9AGAR|nr:antifreeze protein [Roridomyces roridus]